MGPTSQNVANDHRYWENFGWQHDVVENGSDGMEDDGKSDCGISFADLFPPAEVNDKIHVVDNFQFDDEYDYDEVVSVGNSASDDAHGALYIPGMNAGHAPVQIWCPKNYIAGQVVLNNCGSCLIQKHRQLTPTQ